MSVEDTPVEALSMGEPMRHHHEPSYGGAGLKYREIRRSEKIAGKAPRAAANMYATESTLELSTQHWEQAQR